MRRVSAITPYGIQQYLNRHPGLRLFANQQREQLLEVAENNIAKAIEGGDVETSKWLLRSSMAKGRGYEQLIAGRIDGEVTHKHEFTLQIQEAARKLIEAANGVDEDHMIDVTPKVTLPEALNEALDEALDEEGNEDDRRVRAG